MNLTFTRTKKFYDLACINYVLQDFRTARLQARAFPSSLTLGALVIHKLNALFHRPAQREPDTALLTTCCMHVRHDEDSDDDDDDLMETSPIMYDQGMYHACDVVVEDKVLRLPMTRTLDPHHLAFLYSVDTLSTLLSAFTVPQVMLEKGTKKQSQRRVANKKTRTMAVQYLRDDDVVVPQLNLGLHDAGVIVPTVTRETGPDVVGHDVVDSDDDTVEGDIDGIINKIWGQFAYDVFSKAPNRKLAGSDSYLLASTHDIENFTMDVFKSFDLSHIFSHVQAKTVDGVVWSDTLFNRFFPDKGYQPKLRGQVQNFPYLKYFQTWIDLIGRMSKGHVTLVRNALRKEFRQLYWIPFATCDRLWNTKVENGSKWTSYPKNGPCTAAPHIAINARFEKKGRIVVGTVMRGNGGSEDMEADDDE